MSDLSLIVNGRRYGGWKSVQVTRSIESLSGSFSLEASDRWGGQNEPWPIAEEDACRIEINGTVVLDGYVDRRSVSLSASDRTLSYSGRDRAGALVDNSAVLAKWTYRGTNVVDLARTLAAPFGVKVSVQAGLSVDVVKGKVRLHGKTKMVVHPGDSVFETLQREAVASGVLLVSDGEGGILVTRSGSDRATPLVEGENICAASVDYDATARFYRYVLMTQSGGTDDASGESTRVRAEAIDESVRRTDRVLIIRPDSSMSTEYARLRADWEARVRAAKAETVSVTVLGWEQPSGELWPVNAICPVRSPSIGVDGDMLISQVQFSISDAGEVTQLSLVRPDAFSPEPKAVVKTSSGGGWKELAGGAR